MTKAMRLEEGQKGLFFARKSHPGARALITGALVGGVAKDRWPIGRSVPCSNAFQVAHAGCVFAIASLGMGFGPQTAGAAQYSKFSYKVSPRVTRIRSIAGASWFQSRLIEVEVTSSRTSVSNRPRTRDKNLPTCSIQSQA